MAPVRPAAGAPTIATAVFFRSDRRVRPPLSVEDSTALLLNETDSLRTFRMRHLIIRLVFSRDTSRSPQYASGRNIPPKSSRMRRIILQLHLPAKMFASAAFPNTLKYYRTLPAAAPEAQAH